MIDHEELSVHIDALHRDAEEQPSLACLAAEDAAEAKAESRRKRLELDEAKAKVQTQARAHPEAFGIAKVTENAIEAAVTLDSIVGMAERAAIDAELKAGRAESLANAFEHRRAMLRLEVELYLANYFGDVDVKRRQTAPAAAGAAEIQEQKVGDAVRRRRLGEE